jgi:hypothetical protein
VASGAINRPTTRVAACASTRALGPSNTLRSSVCAHTAPNALVLAPITPTGEHRPDIFHLDRVDRGTRLAPWRGDQHRLPARRIPAGGRASRLPAGEADLVLSQDVKGLDEFLHETETLTFVVVYDDRLVYELPGRFQSREPADLVLRCQVARVDARRDRDRRRADSKRRRSGDRAPAELAARDPRFRAITLRHLLAVSSGIRYREDAFPSLGDDTHTIDAHDVPRRLRQLSVGRAAETLARTRHVRQAGPFL